MGTGSDTMLSPTNSWARQRCRFSPAITTPDAFSHLFKGELHHEYLHTLLYLLNCRILFHGRAKSAFIAKPCSAGILRVIPALSSRLLRVCTLRVVISLSSRFPPSPPLMVFLNVRESCTLMRDVRGEQVVARGRVTFIKPMD